MIRRETRDLLMPWAGLICGLVGGAIVHQFGSESTFDRCDIVSPIPLLIVVVLGLAFAAAGGLASWAVLRSDAETQVHKLVATISLGMVALFCFAMLLPAVASLLLPPCFQ